MEITAFRFAQSISNANYLMRGWWNISRWIARSQTSCCLARASLSVLTGQKNIAPRHLRAVHPDWEIRAPMQEGDIWDKCRMQREAQTLGFETPELYRLGFPHFNCGGRCVRAGISHWVHLYHTRRAAFERVGNRGMGYRYLSARARDRAVVDAQRPARRAGKQPLLARSSRPH